MPGFFLFWRAARPVWQSKIAMSTSKHGQKKKPAKRKNALPGLCFCNGINTTILQFDDYATKPPFDETMFLKEKTFRVPFAEDPEAIPHSRWTRFLAWVFWLAKIVFVALMRPLVTKMKEPADFRKPKSLPAFLRTHLGGFDDVQRCLNLWKTEFSALEKEKKVPFVAFGVSRGALVVLRALAAGILQAQNLSERPSWLPRYVILEGCPDQIKNVAYSIMPTFLASLALNLAPFVTNFRAEFDISPEQLIAGITGIEDEKIKYPVPILFVTGMDDTIVPPARSLKLKMALERKNYGASVQMISLPKTSHATVQTASPEAWQTYKLAVQDFHLKHIFCETK